MDPNNVMVQFERDALYFLGKKELYAFLCCFTMSLMSLHLLDTVCRRPNRHPPPPQNTSWSPFIELFAKACIFLYSHVSLGTLIIMDLLHTNVRLIHSIIQ